MGTQNSLTKPTARFSPRISNMATTFSSSIAGLRVAAKTVPAQRRQFAVRAAAEPESEAGGSLDTTASTPKAFCFGLPGNTAPMGDFDPAGFTKDADQNTVKRYREAELTHGRVSMLGITGFIIGENFNPLFGGEIKGPAITQFQQLPNTFWVVILGAVAVAELGRATKGWVSPTAGEGLFQLNEDYIPGDIGFDPLGLSPDGYVAGRKQGDATAQFVKRQEQEINHGRLAMIAVAGAIAQELVSGAELFNLEDDGILNDANCATGVVCDILEKSG